MTQGVRRIFVVGCPRSGTTLVQSCLAAHPQVVSLPETHYFPRMASPRRVVRVLPLAGLAGRRRERRLLEGLGLPVVPRRGLRPLGAPDGTGLVDALDALAARAGCQAWVEKTPAHLHYLRTIRAAAPDAVVVHVVRHGEPVVRSMVAASSDPRYGWGRRYGYVEAARRWHADLHLTVEDVGRPGSVFLRYEDLVRQPAAILVTLLRQVGLGADETLVRDLLRRRLTGAGLEHVRGRWKRPPREIGASADYPATALPDRARRQIAAGEAFLARSDIPYLTPDGRLRA